jgi:hypothetical protein
MAHQGTNTLDIQEGTEINSEYTSFLVKSGSSNEAMTATIDGATIENGNNVLIQVMDNDDATTGGMMDANDPANTNGGSMNFKQVHTENAGFNTAQAVQGSAEQSFTFTNGTYSGNIYNASGSDQSTNGSLDGSPLNVTLGKGAVLNSAAASTAAIHVTYDGSNYVKDTLKGAAVESDDATLLGYQNTSFTISEYFDIGQVANKINDNGANDINMTLTDDAVWNVTGTSVIDKFEIKDNAQVVVGAGATLTVGTKKYAAGTTLTAANLATADAETVTEVTEKEPEANQGGGGMPFGPGGGSAPSYADKIIGSWSGGAEDDYTYDSALWIGQTSVYSEDELNAVKTDADSKVTAAEQKAPDAETAKAAAETAAKCNVRMLALIHISNRYGDCEASLAEAKSVFGNTVAPEDFQMLTVTNGSIRSA